MAGDTPLSLACVNNQWDTVMYLVKEYHCDPKSKLLFDTPAATLSTPTHVYTATVNLFGETPLSLACVNGHFDAVKYFVKECRCDPNCKLYLYVARLGIVSLAAALKFVEKGSLGTVDAFPWPSGMLIVLCT